MSGWSRAALAAALLLASGCTRVGEVATAAGGGPAFQRAWPVMGTMLHAAVWNAPDERAAVIARAVHEATLEVDRALSNYREDSDVTRVNLAAGSAEAIEVTQLTADALALALDHARSTGGAFDPTVGPVVDVWGFYREAGAMPPRVALDSARALVGWQRVELAGGALPRARLARAGMRLDFGAIGKGFAVDRAIAAARAAGATNAMIDLGGNIGVLGAAPGGGDWPVGLRHPREPGTPFAVIDVPDGSSVATSGDYERYFVHEGVRYAHIVDPRSGWPVQGVASVSALAPSGTASDALSTALFVLGVERGCAHIAGMPGVAAIWVLPPDRDGVLRAVAGGPAAARIDVAQSVSLRRCEDIAR